MPPVKPGDGRVTGAPTPDQTTRRSGLSFASPRQKISSFPSSISSRSDSFPLPRAIVYTRSDHWFPRSPRLLTYRPRAGKGEIAGPAARNASEHRPERSEAQPGSPDRSPSAPRRPHDLDRPAAGACSRPGSRPARADRREAPPQRCRETDERTVSTPRPGAPFVHQTGPFSNERTVFSGKNR